jgi:hypothetical protein
MQRLLLLVISFLFISSYQVSLVKEDGSQLSKKDRFAMELKVCQKALANGKPDKCRLYGKIQWVDSFPDVKVQEVTSFPDIKVQIVSSFPDGAGKWQIVSSFPDYKVQRVSSFPDYKIQYVTSFPGCN